MEQYDISRREAYLYCAVMNVQMGNDVIMCDGCICLFELLTRGLKAISLSTISTVKTAVKTIFRMSIT